MEDLAEAAVAEAALKSEKLPNPSTHGEHVQFLHKFPSTHTR